MKLSGLDKVGSIGLLLTAILSPCCFPLLGIGLTALGFGSFELFGGWTMYVFQGFVLLSLVGLFLSYRSHKKWVPLLLAVPGTLLIFTSYHFIDEDYWIYLMYAGMAAITIASFLNIYLTRKHKTEIITTSIITCPACGHKQSETMPLNACQYFYVCTHCQTRLQAKPGDCCVFCSYGTVVCPPMQSGEDCCA
ncbi:MAG: MerC domain-containing protein [Bacteroidota bacterium]